MKISTDVKNAPVSSTVNDCANGSSSSTNTVLIIVFVIITGGGGAGRFLITTSVCLRVSTTPLVL